jgi:FkbM family methyltransferase
MHVMTTRQIRGHAHRLARSLVERADREEQARRVLARYREARALIAARDRRNLRDEHAMRVVLASILRPASNMIDVGANEGAVLREAIRLAPDGRHIAFEPIGALCARLRRAFPQVDVRDVALSDAAGRAEFAYVPGAPPYSGFRRRADLPRGAGDVQHIVVETARLDDVLPAGYVPSLLKVDVEGAELQVLRGAVDTLARHQPLVLFEHGVGGADLYGTHPTEVYDLLAGVGLRIFDLDGEGPYGRDRFEATFREPVWNFLAVPSG